MEEKNRVSYVEKVGVFFEQNGYSPVAGRILGYLMTADDRGRSFYEIHQFVKASKSSVSTALTRLIETGIVRYLTISGDRKRYFFIDTKPWITHTKSRAEFFVLFASLVGECIALREDKDSSFTKGLVHLEKFHHYLAEEFPKLIEKWTQVNS